MPTLTLEVTIRLSVERDGLTDEELMRIMRDNRYLIRMRDWDAVHVRVAPTEETPANG